MKVFGFAPGTAPGSVGAAVGSGRNAEDDAPPVALGICAQTAPQLM